MTWCATTLSCQHVLGGAGETPPAALKLDYVTIEIHRFRCILHVVTQIMSNVPVNIHSKRKKLTQMSLLCQFTVKMLLKRDDSVITSFYGSLPGLCPTPDSYVMS